MQAGARERDRLEVDHDGPPRLDAEVLHGVLGASGRDDEDRVLGRVVAAPRGELVELGLADDARPKARDGQVVDAGEARRERRVEHREQNNGHRHEPQRRPRSLQAPLPRCAAVEPQHVHAEGHGSQDRPDTDVDGAAAKCRGDGPAPARPENRRHRNNQRRAHAHGRDSGRNHRQPRPRVGHKPQDGDERHDEVGADDDAEGDRRRGQHGRGLAPPQAGAHGAAERKQRQQPRKDGGPHQVEAQHARDRNKLDEDVGGDAQHADRHRERIEGSPVRRW